MQLMGVRMMALISGLLAQLSTGLVMKASRGGEFPGLMLLGMNLAGIEDSLLSMAREGATPELLPFIGTITVMVDQMIAEVYVQRESSQASLNSSWLDLLQCQPIASQVVSNLSQWAANHRQCRSEECALVADINSQCTLLCGTQILAAEAKCNTFRTGRLQSGDPLINHFPTPGYCDISTSFQSSKPWMIILRDNFKAMYENWEKAWSDCQNATQIADTCNNTCQQKQFNLTDKIATCNGMQADLELQACGTTSQACSNYHQCYSNKLDAFKTINATVVAQEENYLSQHLGLLHVRCLLAAFNASISDKMPLGTGIENCKAIDFSGPTYRTGLYINYKAVPPEQTCSNVEGASPFAPGSSRWKSAYYYNLGSPSCSRAYNPVCNAPCCAGSTTVIAGGAKY